MHAVFPVKTESVHSHSCCTPKYGGWACLKVELGWLSLIMELYPDRLTGILWFFCLIVPVVSDNSFSSSASGSIMLLQSWLMKLVFTLTVQLCTIWRNCPTHPGFYKWPVFRVPNPHVGKVYTVITDQLPLSSKCHLVRSTPPGH